MKGKIKNLVTDRGFGFIKGNDGREYFFHFSNVIDPTVPEKLCEGDTVEFRVSQQGRNEAAIQVKVCEDELVTFFKENVLKINGGEVDYDEFCDKVQEYAYRLRNGKVTTSMIRKVYSRIMSADQPKQLKILRPQFAYTAGRNEDNIVLREFMDILDYLASKIELNNTVQLNNFKQFMEAVVAYRKYVGKDK